MLPAPIFMQLLQDRLVAVNALAPGYAIGVYDNATRAAWIHYRAQIGLWPIIQDPAFDNLPRGWFDAIYTEWRLTYGGNTAIASENAQQEEYRQRKLKAQYMWAKANEAYLSRFEVLQDGAHIGPIVLERVGRLPMGNQLTYTVGNPPTIYTDQATGETTQIGVDPIIIGDARGMVNRIQPNPVPFNMPSSNDDDLPETGQDLTIAPESVLRNYRRVKIGG